MRRSLVARSVAKRGGEREGSRTVLALVLHQDLRHAPFDVRGLHVHFLRTGADVRRLRHWPRQRARHTNETGARARREAATTGFGRTSPSPGLHPIVINRRVSVSCAPATPNAQPTATGPARGQDAAAGTYPLEEVPDLLPDFVKHVGLRLHLLRVLVLIDLRERRPVVRGRRRRRRARRRRGSRSWRRRRRRRRRHRQPLRRLRRGSVVG